MLIDSAVDLGDPSYDHIFGHGGIDAYEAVTNATVSVADAGVASRPSFPLRPKPFRGQLHLTFMTGRHSPAIVSIFDAAGRLVRRLDEDVSSGRAPSSIVWDGRGRAGKEVEPGVYFVAVDADGLRTARRVLLIRRHDAGHTGPRRVSNVSMVRNGTQAGPLRSGRRGSSG